MTVKIHIMLTLRSIVSLHAVLCLQFVRRCRHDPNSSVLVYAYATHLEARNNFDGRVIQSAGPSQIICRENYVFAIKRYDRKTCKCVAGLRFSL